MDLYNASQGQEHEEEIPLTIEQYEEAKVHLNTIIERADKARRLADNDDFKDLIMVGYFEDEPKRLAELMASGRIQNEMTMNNCKSELEAIGKFRNFMKLHIEQGSFARDELAALEEARDESIKMEEEMAG